MKKIYLLLSLLASFSFAQNTQTKDDAGASGGNSGFYETLNPNSNYPSGASSWWHLLDVRHTNTTNNYAMQFSGSFFDQSLWFRKTNNVANQAWNKVVLENPQGNVGIGISNPTEKFQVLNGNILVGNDNLQGGALYFGNPNHGFRRDNNTVTMYTAGHSESALTFNGASGEQMRIDYKGNVGIGVSNPQNKLDVNGVIHSKEVKVDMEGWADYVFKKEYNLPTLQEVEQHIQEKGHLPSVPSEKDVIENGLSLGENQKLLLQKIEELTLYIIELSKEIQELKKN